MPRLNNPKGVALLIAIFAVMLIMHLASELSYETNVDFIVNSQSINRLKSYYAAKSGVELSLLRIHIFRKVSAQFSKQLGPKAQILDQIWSLPFAWPPLPPTEISSVDKHLIDKVVKESAMDSSYVTVIEDEGSKIDINDLDSPSIALKETTRRQLLTILENKVKDDPEWNERHRDFEPNALIDHITDWIDENTESLRGGSESAFYKDFEGEFPPNRSFRTLAELRMVAGMTDDLYELLSTRVTIYGMKGINPNHASKEVLRSLDASLTDEACDKILKRRADPNEGGPFANLDDFLAFLGSININIPKDSPIAQYLIFDAPYNFKITSTAQFGKTSREIQAIVYDVDKIKTRMQDLIKKENPTPTPTPIINMADGAPAKNPTNPLPKGRPQVVYWKEK